MEILLAVAAADSNVLKDPAPAVVFQGFGESALNFGLRVWTLVQANLDTKSRLSIALAPSTSRSGHRNSVPAAGSQFEIDGQANKRTPRPRGPRTAQNRVKRRSGHFVLLSVLARKENGTEKGHISRKGAKHVLSEVEGDAKAGHGGFLLQEVTKITEIN